MKKLTLLMAGLMLAGATYAHDGKACCKGKKGDCKKEAKADCKDKKGCCKKGAETAKK